MDTRAALKADILRYFLRAGITDRATLAKVCDAIKDIAHGIRQIKACFSPAHRPAVAEFVRRFEAVEAEEYAFETSAREAADAKISTVLEAAYPSPDDFRGIIEIWPDRVAIHLEYDSPMIGRIKTLGARWNRTDKEWYLPLSSAQVVAQLGLPVVDVR